MEQFIYIIKNACLGSEQAKFELLWLLKLFSMECTHFKFTQRFIFGLLV